MILNAAQVHALYAHLGIACEVYQFSDTPDEPVLAHDNLMARIESYFAASWQADAGYGASATPVERINRTLLPPIYLQQPGHSLTIVGFERHTDGSCNLMVLDPLYITSRGMHQLLDAGIRSLRKPRIDVMDVYRRGDRRLRRHLDFEALM
jgi:hypothetical protein